MGTGERVGKKAGGNPNRCPGCGGFGTSSLGGLCRACDKKRTEKYRESAKEPHMLRKNYRDYGIRVDDAPLFPSEFPCMTDKYGIEKEGPK